jgi:hypothetical protein
MPNITRITRKLVDVAASIAEVDCENPEFLHAVLAQVSLPRNPTKERSFTRSSGAASVLIKAGDWYDGIKWVPQPLPSGTRPRLVLIHACSEAVRTKSLHVEIGDSVRDFLRHLNIDTGGRSMAYFRREMIALSACEMTFGWRGPDGPEQAKASPVRKFRAWSTNEGGQACLWPGYLELDHGATCISSSVLSIAIRRNSSAGSCTPCDRRKRSIRRARVEQVRGGLRLLPSPPPIAKKAVVVKLPAPAAPLPKPAAIPIEITAPLISEDALDKVREIAPGWDRQFLAARYRAWMEGRERPKKPDAAFLGWVRRFTKSKPPG